MGWREQKGQHSTILNLFSNESFSKAVIIEWFCLPQILNEIKRLLVCLRIGKSDPKTNIFSISARQLCFSRVLQSYVTCRARSSGVGLSRSSRCWSIHLSSATDSKNSWLPFVMWEFCWEAVKLIYQEIFLPNLCWGSELSAQTFQITWCSLLGRHCCESCWATRGQRWEVNWSPAEILWLKASCWLSKSHLVQKTIPAER